MLSESLTPIPPAQHRPSYVRAVAGGLITALVLTLPGFALAQDSPRRLCRDDARLNRRAAEAEAEAEFLDSFADAQREYADELRSLIGLEDLEERRERARDARDRLRDARSSLREVKKEARRAIRDQYREELEACDELENGNGEESSRSSRSRSSRSRSSRSFSKRSSSSFSWIREETEMNFDRQMEE